MYLQTYVTHDYVKHFLFSQIKIFDVNVSEEKPSLIALENVVVVKWRKNAICNWRRTSEDR